MEDNVFAFKKEDEEEDIIVGDRYETSGLIDDDHWLSQINNVEWRTDIPFVQGDNNPTKRYTVSRIVNFDSHYRTILDPSSVVCPVVDPTVINDLILLLIILLISLNLFKMLLKLPLKMLKYLVLGMFLIASMVLITTALTNKLTLSLFLVVIIPLLLFFYKN